MDEKKDNVLKTFNSCKHEVLKKKLEIYVLIAQGQ